VIQRIVLAIFGQNAFENLVLVDQFNVSIPQRFSMPIADHFFDFEGSGIFAPAARA